MSSAGRDTATLLRTGESQDLALFHRTLAELCRSEVPLPRALRLLGDDLETAPLRDAARRMAEDVEAGVPLAETYAAHGAAFPPLYRALLEAGAAAGDLPAVLEEIAAHAAARAEVAARLRGALAYPLLAAGVVVVVGAGLFVFVAPTLAEIADTVAGSGRTAEYPAAASIDFGLGTRWFAAGAGLVLLALVAGVIALVARYRRPLDGTRGASSLALRVPVLGRLRLYAALSSLAATLGMLLRRSVPLPKALALAAEACEHESLRARMRAAAAAAEGGAGLAAAVGDAEVFAPSLTWILDSAERRGQGAGAFDDVARIYRSRLARATDRAALLATPAAELVVGIVVFLLAFSFVVPLVEFTGALFRVSGS